MVRRAEVLALRAPPRLLPLRHEEVADPFKTAESTPKRPPYSADHGGLLQALRGAKRVALSPDPQPLRARLEDGQELVRPAPLLRELQP